VIPRSNAEAINTVRYRARLHALHCRFYRRMQKLLTFFSLLAGAAALAPVWQSMPGGLPISAAVIATVSMLNTVGGFGASAIHHESWMNRAAELLARTGGMDTESIDAERLRLPGDHVIIESLRAVAWNDVLRSVGLEGGMRPESFRQRLFRLFA
jgi:hypothetical protein